ncbi:MAG TPA: hypothetical protein DCO86_03290 [Spirochaetaceae bacterium]|nr:hypothetical protein [Spirochaetaceae bacterium]
MRLLIRALAFSQALLALVACGAVSCTSASVIERTKTDASIAVELAELYGSNGDKEGELNTLLSFVEQYSITTDPQVAYNLALRYYEDGDYRRAVDVCMANRDIYRAHVRFNRLACSCYIAMGDFENALRLYDDILHSGDKPTEEDILRVCRMMDEHGDPSDKKRVIDIAMDEGLFSKKILEIAADMDKGEDEYDMLLRYAK